MSILLAVSILSFIILIIHIECQKVAKQCEYHCENEKQKAWNRPGYTFQSNGCGSMGIRVNVDERIQHCCDTHDSCYGS